MMQIQDIKTERLELKKISMKDFDDYVEWRSQTEYHKFLPSQPKTKKEYKKSLKKAIKDYKNKKEPTLMWGIFYNKKLIGSVTIEDWNLTHRYCELGWGLNPNSQRQGFAKEACEAAIAYIFNVLNMNRIAAFVWEGNEQSKALAEKLGFVHEGTDRKARFKNGKFLDVYCLGLLKDEWKNN